MNERGLGRVLFVAFGWLVSALLLLPVLVIVVSAFNAGATPAFPPDGLSLRWFEAFWADEAFVDATISSLIIACVAASLAVAVGLPAALWVSRTSSPLGVAMEAFLLSPLMLATIVLGVAILQVLVVIGLPTSPLAISLGHAIIGTPYVARLVLATLAGAPADCERAARSLGAGPVRAFCQVTLPLARAGVVAGGLFALLISLDDVNVALFLSDVDTTTLPVRTLSYIQQNADPLASAVSAVMVAVVLSFLVVADRVFGIDRMFGLSDTEAKGGRG